MGEVEGEGGGSREDGLGGRARAGMEAGTSNVEVTMATNSMEVEAINSTIIPSLILESCTCAVV